jgi:hypothetical protein
MLQLSRYHDASGIFATVAVAFSKREIAFEMYGCQARELIKG